MFAHVDAVSPPADAAVLPPAPPARSRPSTMPRHPTSVASAYSDHDVAFETKALYMFAPSLSAKCVCDVVA